MSCRLGTNSRAYCSTFDMSVLYVGNGLNSKEYLGFSPKHHLIIQKYKIQRYCAEHYVEDVNRFEINIAVMLLLPHFLQKLFCSSITS